MASTGPVTHLVLPRTMSEESTGDEVFQYENLGYNIMKYDRSPVLQRKQTSDSGGSSCHPSTSEENNAEESLDSVFYAVRNRNNSDSPTPPDVNKIIGSGARRCRDHSVASGASSHSSSDCDKQGVTELVSEETQNLTEKLCGLIIEHDTSELQELISSNADVIDELCCAYNSRGMTPVTLASSLGFTDVLQLLDASCNIWLHSPDENGLCAIHSAIANCHVETVDYLAEKGQWSYVSRSGRTPLHFAAECGNEAILITVLKHVVNINEVTKSGKTALHLASSNGLTDSVRMLLQNGANIDAEDNNGFSSLSFAASEGHVDVISLLVDSGASVNHATVDGLICLFLALLDKHTEASILLIDLGSSLHLTDYAGLNALHRAVVFDEPTVVKHIMNTGKHIDINCPTKLGMTALSMAVKFHNLEITDLLIQAGADVNTVENHDGLYPLYHAVDTNNLELIQMVLTNNAKVNAQTTKGNTALYQACKLGHPDVVRLLIQNGANINLARINGFTPLHIAVRSGQTQLVELLIEAGADPNICDKHGQTCLAIAAYLQQSEIVKLLSPKCSTPQAIVKVALLGNSNILLYLRLSNTSLCSQNSVGRTPLHICCEEGHALATETLLKVIPDDGINLTDFDGSTPLHLAVLNGHYNIARMLVHRQASLNTTTTRGQTVVTAAVEQDNRQMVDLLLRHGADINHVNTDGQTPLFQAVEKGSLELVDYLLRKGAIASIRANDGMTPIMVSAKLGKTDILKRLLAAGAKANRVDSMENSLLHIAARHGSVDTILELLFDKLVNVDAENILGKTALQVAAHEGHMCVVEVLLDAGSKLQMLDEHGCVKYDLAKHSSVWETLKTWSNPPNNTTTTRQRELASIPATSASSSSTANTRSRSQSSTCGSNLLPDPWARIDRRASDSEIAGAGGRQGPSSSSSRITRSPHPTPATRSASLSPTPPVYSETIAASIRQRQRSLALARTTFLNA